MGSYKWVISPLIWLISIVTLIITPFITTHEPPRPLASMRIVDAGSQSHLRGLGCRGLGFRVWGFRGSGFRGFRGLGV